MPRTFHPFLVAMLFKGIEIRQNKKYSSQNSTELEYLNRIFFQIVNFFAIFKEIGKSLTKNYVITEILSLIYCYIN
jgi:hypothetical protein